MDGAYRSTTEVYASPLVMSNKNRNILQLVM